MDALVYKDKLPSQISLTLSFQPEKSSKLKDIKVSLKEGSIEKDDETGIYKYKVSLKKESKKDELVVTYYFQSKRTYYTSILSSITESDIGNIDNINGDILKLPTDASIPSTPTFNLLSKSGVKFQVKLKNFENGDNVRRNDKEGKYEYKVVIEKEGLSREIVMNYRFQSEIEKKYSEIDSTIQDNLEESLFNNITEEDIKIKDGLTFTRADKPSTKGSPTFTVAGYNIKSLNKVIFELVAGTVSKNDGAGSYSYQAEVRYSLSSRKKNLSKRVQVTYVVNSEISSITENDIKAVDGINPSPTALASSVANPPVFNTRGGLGGVTGVTLSLVGNVRVSDSAGLYEYEVKVSKSGKEKTLRITYSNFETSTERRERLDKMNLRSLIVSDIKGIDSLSPDRNVLPSVVGNPVFSIPVSGLRGLSNLTISATGITKSDNAGTYRYTANLEKHGEKRTLSISYVGYKNTLTVNQERDLARLNQFTEAEIKSIDDITVGVASLSPDKDPIFTRRNLHGFTSTDYTMILVAGTRVKNDNQGTYSYRVRLSSVSTSQTRDVDILYSGYLTASGLALNQDKTKIARFTEDDIKQWDGINVSASVNAITLPDKPTFTLPSTYGGLTGFKVEFVGVSASKDNDDGTYSYEVRVTNAGGTASKSIVVSYTGFNTKTITQFTESDIKRWDGINPDKTVSVSSLPNVPTFTLPLIYRGVSDFTVRVLGTSLKDDSFGDYKYTVEVRNNSDTIRKTIKISYFASFKPNIKIDRTFTGHTNWVFSVGFSPDGAKIISGSRDNSIKLWQVSDGSLIRTLTGHTNSVHSVGFSPDGAKIISGSRDNSIKLWQVSDGSLIRTLTASNPIKSVQFSPDGTKIASGSATTFSFLTGAASAGTVKLWKVSDGTQIRTLQETDMSDYIPSVQFSSDGTKVFAAIDSSTFKIWKVSDGTQTKKFSPSSSLTGGRSYFFDVSPDETKFISGSVDNSIKIWSVSDGSLIKTLTGHTSRVHSVGFSPDGTKIVSGSGDSSIKIWNVSDGSLIKTLTGHSSTVHSVGFSPDGMKIVSGSVDNSIKIWE